MKVYKRISSFLCFLAIVSVGSLIFAPWPSSAANTSLFDPENIISDDIFTNNNSMTAVQIQSFLDTKPSACLKDFTTLSLRDDNGDGRVDDSGSEAYGPETMSAAQVIKAAADIYRINPQVILATLEKEQGLVSRTDCPDWRYNTALGYGCPDTAPCNQAAYGFTRQIDYGVFHFRGFFDDSLTYVPYGVGSNTVAYNPNSSCGSTVLNIQNRATASLYSYTPYQPNDATLAAAPGQIVDCGAYGNLNFWRYFTDWFGPTTTKPLIRTEASGNLYYTDGEYKYSVTSMDVAAQYGYGTGDVGFVSQSYIDALEPAPLSPTLNYFAKTDSDSDADGADVYLISNGQRFRVTSGEQMTRFGLNISQLTYLPYYSLARLPLVGDLSDFVRGSDGFVYKVDADTKAGIFQLSLYNSLNSGGSVSTLSSFVLSTLTTTSPLIQGYLALKGSDGRVWLATQTQWSYVGSSNVIDCLGIGAKLISFTPTQAAIGTQDASASCMMTDPSNSTSYLIDKTKKYVLRSSWGLNATTAPSAAVFSDKTTAAAQDLSIFKSTTTGALYTIEGGFRRYIESMSVLGEVGQTESGIISMSSGTLAFIPGGHNRVASGKLFKNSSTGQLYVINRDTKIYIPSMALFNAYNYGSGSLNLVASSTLAKYTSSTSNLQWMFKIGSNTYFVDNKQRRLIPSDLVNHYGAQSSPTYETALSARATASSALATRYIKSSSSAQLYYLENGNKRPVNNWATFTSLGGTNNNITTLSNEFTAIIPTGASM